MSVYQRLWLFFHAKQVKALLTGSHPRSSSEFLGFIFERLRCVHNENANVDYMQELARKSYQMAKIWEGLGLK